MMDRLVKECDRCEAAWNYKDTTKVQKDVNYYIIRGDYELEASSELAARRVKELEARRAEKHLENTKPLYYVRGIPVRDSSQ